MTKEYKISGMTCGGCVANVKRSLENLEVVETADIQLAAPQGKPSLKKEVNLATLQNAIGHYQIEEIKTVPEKKKRLQQ